MSHRALLYSVRVKRKRKNEYAMLGDLDGTGRSLAGQIVAYLNGAVLVSEDELKTVTCDDLNVTFDGDETDEVFASLQNGEKGVAALIEDETGQEKARLKLPDTARVRCGALFVLPRTQERGWMAVHSNAGRAVTGLIAPHLRDTFKEHFDELRLQFNPVVDQEALKRAVLDNKIVDVRLTKLAKPGDQADGATERWVPTGDVGKIEVVFKPARGRGKFLKAGPLRQFIQGSERQQQTALDKIVEFNGVKFDEARVAVILPNGSERTYYVQREATGHPMGIEIDGQIALDDDDNPTFESIRTALREALESTL